MLIVFRFIVPVSMIVINDVMAYMFGFFFGRTPLIKLSPKKTWEGFIGGGISTVIFGLLVMYFMQVVNGNKIDYCVLIYCCCSDVLRYVSVPLFRLSYWIQRNFGKNDYGLRTIELVPTARIYITKQSSSNIKNGNTSLYTEYFNYMIYGC